MAAEAGRNPDEVPMSVFAAPQVAERLKRYRDAGVDRAVFMIPTTGRDEALKNLAIIDPRQCKIVEMKFFGGLTVAEIADVLQVSSDTIERDWKMARAWLHLEISNR